MTGAEKIQVDLWNLKKGDVIVWKEATFIITNANYTLYETIVEWFSPSFGTGSSTYQIGDNGHSRVTVIRGVA